MHATSAKQDAIDAIQRLPYSAPMDEIVYRLYVLSKVQQGIRDVDAGRTITSEELAREIEAW
jgi:predicted transcriptional regulator